MKIINITTLSLILSLSFILSFCSADDSGTNLKTINFEDGVLVLNLKNFDEMLKLHPKILVDFYHPRW